MDAVVGCRVHGISNVVLAAGGRLQMSRVLLGILKASDKCSGWFKQMRCMVGEQHTCRESRPLS